jgi:hypothetical protein
MLVEPLTAPPRLPCPLPARLRDLALEGKPFLQLPLTRTFPRGHVQSELQKISNVCSSLSMLFESIKLKWGLVFQIKLSHFYANHKSVLPKRFTRKTAPVAVSGSF